MQPSKTIIKQIYRKVLESWPGNGPGAFDALQISRAFLFFWRLPCCNLLKDFLKGNFTRGIIAV